MMHETHNGDRPMNFWEARGLALAGGVVRRKDHGRQYSILEFTDPDYKWVQPALEAEWEEVAVLITRAQFNRTVGTLGITSDSEAETMKNLAEKLFRKDSKIE